MATLPPLLVLSIVLGVLGLSTTAFLYWKREPEKTQAAVRRVFTFFTPVWLLIRRPIGWAMTVVALTLLAPIYLVAAIFFVTVRCILCKPAKVVVKFS